MLFCWRDWGEEKDLQEWLLEAVQVPSHAIKLLRRLMAKTIVNGVKEIPYLPASSIENLLPLETLNTALDVVTREELSDSDKRNLTMLKKALILKQEGKPYSEVYLDGAKP